MFGAPIPCSVDLPDVRQAADFAVTKLADVVNSIEPPILKEILKCETSVVAGTKYNLRILTAIGAEEREFDVVVLRGLPQTEEWDMLDFTPIRSD